jgi:ubiquinone/menaquinone biosynthesis C-methylase UbiE
MKENSKNRIFEKILEHTILKNKKVLEIGCGVGRISSFLSTETKHLIAIDPDEIAIKHAKARVSGVDFRVGSGEKLDFHDNYFDLVIFTLSLHHQNSEKALSEAARVLRTGGSILTIEPVTSGEVEIIFSFLQNENKETEFAQNSVINSGLLVDRSEVFTANWVFENKEDLFSSVFEYYNMPFSDNTAQEIARYLERKLNCIPLICEDKMIIQSLIVPE